MPRRRAVRAVRCHRPGALAHARADGGLDRLERLGRLLLKRRAGARGRGGEHLEEGVLAGQRGVRRHHVPRDARALEAGRLERAARVARVGEVEKGQRRRAVHVWQLDVGVAVGGDGAEHELEAGPGHRRLPHREGYAAARPQHAEGLVERLLRLRQVQQPKADDDGIERAVVERQRRRVALHERHAPRERVGHRLRGDQHLRREVERDNLADAALRGDVRDLARAARHIEDAFLGAVQRERHLLHNRGRRGRRRVHARRVQQRVGRLSCDLCEGVAVCRRARLPHLVLERSERVGRERPREPSRREGAPRAQH
mmetsp:Transcript_10351/g.26864  ORF Transcript_10351/g.26864 Transcript_10351/m.26864 type:complete len:314 (+) Transcript_10351:229-1170(+)